MAVMKAFIITSLPFVLSEAATGAVSFIIREARVPPAVGVGTALDVRILAAGLVAAVLRAAGAR